MMFSEVPFFNYCIWSILRMILYQFLMVFSFYNLHDLPKYTLEFKEKVEFFASISNIQFPIWLKNQLEEPETLFLVILIVALISGIMATLGIKLFQFISGVLILSMAIVYYPPMKPSDLKPGEAHEVLAQKYPWIDTLLIGVFGLLMILHSLKNFKDEDFYFLREDGGKKEVIEPIGESNKEDKESKKKR